MKTLLILLLALNLYANAKQKMYSLYKDSQYKEACNVGHNAFSYNTQDEEYISLYAFSCLNSDYIDRLSTPIAMLKFSKEARSNSAYFAIILMQKKMLYHALIDGYDLENLSLPTTDYVLSKVFDFYVKLGKHKSQAYYTFKNKEDGRTSYKLYLNKNERITKMVIEELYDSVIIKQHIYW